jgi:hypothetical protein
MILARKIKRDLCKLLAKKIEWLIKENRRGTKLCFITLFLACFGTTPLMGAQLQDLAMRQN